MTSTTCFPQHLTNSASPTIQSRAKPAKWPPEELTFRIHQRYGHELPLTERLAELNDEYAILEYGDRTVDQVNAEVTAEARRLAAHPAFPPNPQTSPADAHRPTLEFPLNELQFP